MGTAAFIAEQVLRVFQILLIFRLIMEYVFLLARSFRPSGIFAILLELTYTVTDPPIKALRRVLPPLRIGQVSLDLAFLVVFLVLSFVLIPLTEQLQR